MLRQSVAGNSPFRGIVFCNLGTSKTVINIRHHGKYGYRYISPYGYPNNVLGGQKNVKHTKNLSRQMY
jgi:hypothetical protein